MNQEEYMDLHALKNEGWTNKQIAEGARVSSCQDPQVAQGGRPAQEGRGSR